MAALFIFPAKETSTSGRETCSACTRSPAREPMISGFLATASSTSFSLGVPPRKYSSMITDSMLKMGTTMAIISAVTPKLPPGSSSMAMGSPSSTKLLRKAAWIITPRRWGVFSTSNVTTVAMSTMDKAAPTTSST